MDIIGKITEELGVRRAQTEAAVKLIEEGNTIPFIARYRKEATGALNDEQLRNLNERYRALCNLEERKEHVLATIEELEMLTDEIRDKILAAETMVAVEDLYRPYRPKKKTRAGMAREKGLGPLADHIMAMKATEPVEIKAKEFINEEKGVLTEADAIQGALDIIAEVISDNADYREYIRKNTCKEGVIQSSAKSLEEKSVYEMYYDYSEPVSKIAGHRVLALNRGEAEKILNVKLVVNTDKIMTYLERHVIKKDNQYTTPLLKEAISDSYIRLIAPSIEREIRNELTEKAEDGAIAVFGKNLKQLLLQPPIAGNVVLGWDPAFRTGCKLSVVDPTGKVLDTAVIFPTAPQNKVKESIAEVLRLVNKYKVDLISVGNGTASRESEAVIVDIIRQSERPLRYVIVNEAGASVYSASSLATEEFPDLDVGQRSATSIARRLQDPLSELVKIDPKSIGVGQYQHDMNQKKLSDSLDGVVESCVNSVGVDVNTASAALLEHVAGVGKQLAKNIVAYRDKNGSFHSRKELLKVEKLGPKAYEQCAGFLRIREGDDLFDNTGVHPESYKAAELLLKEVGIAKSDLASGNWKDIEKRAGELSALIGVGEMTLKDIITELEKPGRDPREEMPRPILKKDVMEMSDLEPGMVLKGTVRNVIDFGVFVDIGVHQDGLVHISQITDKYIKHPLDVLSVGDIVDVRIMSVDMEKKRISLTMKI
ncbi:MAG: RNA-binding transcriptional accessory protein [Lachnospiraceae bacterium]|nr:RNA-binding transcriptional accessory protein [Lachnospiraceae bacterium]